MTDDERTEGSEESIEDLEAAGESQDDVAGGAAAACPGGTSHCVDWTGKQTCFETVP